MIKETIILFILFACCTIFDAGAQTWSAAEIVKKADDKSRGLASQGEMVMTIVRPTWTRSVTLKSWQKGRSLTLILITAPAAEKGQAFLKIHTDMWNWMPSIEKMIKIPPSMMLQSWMGSDFTNDDLVKESSILNDYDHHLLGEDSVRNHLCYKIEMIPHPDAAVTWGKVIVWITTDGFDEWKVEYYDEDMKLINVMNAFNILKMGDREIPTKLEIIPAGSNQKKTILETKNVVFNRPIDDNFFSQQKMRQLSQGTK